VVVGFAGGVYGMARPLASPKIQCRVRLSLSKDQLEEIGMTVRYDEIGYWSELKLEIVRKYALAYSQILSKQAKPPLYHVYIDGFSGGGIHLSRTTGLEVQGSPQIALNLSPPFREYFLVDLDGEKVEHLRALVGDRTDVHLYEGDCNQILVEDIFPNVSFKSYRRGLCLLDPYGLHLNWKVIETAGKLKTIDLFLNFPIMDMNRNALWGASKRERVSAVNLERMTAFWGDDSWQSVAYQPSPQLNLFQSSPELEKQGNEAIAKAFLRRLKEGAGFANVPAPLPMRNSNGAIVYYLFFASPKAVANKIIEDIFDTYRDRLS
jgi:three-Cys-motif partner protein